MFNISVPFVYVSDDRVFGRCQYQCSCYVLSGILYHIFYTDCCRSEDANKAFSTAVQMYDTLVKAWAHWGDYLENLFTRERSWN